MPSFNNDKDSSIDTNTTPHVSVSSSSEPTRPSAIVGSDYRHLQMLETWLITRTYRDQRRFLEEFPALLDLRSDELIEGTLMVESADLPQQLQELHAHLVLLRDIRAQGSTIEAIHYAYVNLWGGLTLDIPPWLEAVEQQLEELERAVRPDQTVNERIALLRQVIAQAQSDPAITLEMMAELQCRLGNAWYDHPLSERKQAPDEPIACYEAALQVYTADRYPYQYGRVQYYLARAYVDRLAGKPWENQEKAIACCKAGLRVCPPDRYPSEYAQIYYALSSIYEDRIQGDQRENLEKAITYSEEALRVYTLDAYPEEYASTQNNLGNIYHKRIVGERQANLEQAITCYEAALQIYTLQTHPREYAMVQNNLAGVYPDRIAGDRQANLEQAITCYKAALQIYTLTDFPLDYAMVQNNLGTVYAEQIAGNPQENLERAIACYQEALRVRTRELFPTEYARTQLNLGMAYGRRVVEERWENLERAIACYQETLTIYTREDFPTSWAAAQNGLGGLYRERIIGERRANLEQALACYEAALEVYTRENFPQEWAATQAGLGSVSSMRIAGEQRANLERAIAHCEAALQVFTREAFPVDWAATQNGLGTIYRERIAGERQANLEHAIAYFEAALQVYTYDSFPSQWADVQHHLGSAYPLRMNGERWENFEKAIACSEAALQVYTREMYPVEWAHIHNSLGIAYTLRIIGEQQANRECAIMHYEAALQIFAADTFPVEHAMILHNLGNVYARRIAGKVSTNQEKAIAFYEEALRVYTLEAFPTEHWRTQLSIARVEGQRRNWAGAREAYEHARSAENLLVRLGAGAVGRDDILKNRHDAATREGFVLLRLGQIEEATVAIERGRARGLAEALTLDVAAATLIRDEELRTRYEQARAALLAAQIALNSPLSRHLPESERRRAYLEQSEAYYSAQETFEEIVSEIRAAQDPGDFLLDTLDAATILHAAECGGEGHALVYLIATPWGGAGVTAFSANPVLHTQARFDTLELPLLTDRLVAELIETRIDPHTRSIIGGFGHAQQGDMFSWLLYYWSGATFHERASVLHATCTAANLTSTLDSAAQDVLRTPSLKHLVDQLFNELHANDRDFLASAMQRLLLKLELRRCLATLTEVALQPLVAWLCDQGATSLTLIPCGWLPLFPLTAATVVDGSTVIETLPTSVAPSARSLLPKKASKTERSGIYMLGDPRPTHQVLPWGEAEAFTIAKLARHSGLYSEVKVQHYASRDVLIRMLGQGCVVDASCHGMFDASDFLQTALLLAKGTRLTLADMLNHEADLRGLRLLILSACRTAILDLRGAIDEVRSLAVGMVQAGAVAVLASLWRVDDKATYLLMVRFAQEWLPHMQSEPPAAALARAQRWLRTVTNRELQSWRYGAADAEEKVRMAAMQQDDPDACPYADPVYWAGFQITGW